MSDGKWCRRDFFRISGQAAGALALTPFAVPSAGAQESSVGQERNSNAVESIHQFNRIYTDERLENVSFPMGGIGAGMICLDGTGSLSHVSIRNRPELLNEPCIFAAVSIKGPHRHVRVLEGPVPKRKIFGMPGSGNGDVGATYALPRFRTALFEGHFPFGTVSLVDETFPLAAKLVGWSPFEAGDADNSSLPVAAIEYSFTNTSSEVIDAVFSFNTEHFLATDGCANTVRPIEDGFVLWNGPAPNARWQEVALSITARSSDVKVNHCWFRGDWSDAFALAWRDVELATYAETPPVQDGSPGASLFVPLHLDPGASSTVIVQLAWYSGWSSLRLGIDSPEALAEKEDTYRPWYAGRFHDINDLTLYWQQKYPELRAKTARFSSCFYDSSLPPEVMEAVAANLSILKSPTVLRQIDGKFWGWEGSKDDTGSCSGSCTHVWNFSQAVAHLFPALERSLRETEFGPCQDDQGRQVFRSSLPIRVVRMGEVDAADGQLGGIIKVYRDWRISGDDAWLKSIWPKIKLSLAYCIKTWDPRHTGVLEEPQHNTYDIEFWGAEPMCSSLYLAALQAATLMSDAVGDDAALYKRLLGKGKTHMESDLFNNEYFFQRVHVDSSRNPKLTMNHDGTIRSSPESLNLIEKEGPVYQYGDGCMSAGMLGVWMSMLSGVQHTLDSKKINSHMQAVYKYNFKNDLSGSSNTRRPNYALGKEGGLLLCTWPRGGRPSLPFFFCDEVWTGIEYQVASLMIQVGMVDEGLEIVRTCRSRYDGSVRNPYDEFECGHWYARAMSSYALVQALSGARYDAVEKTLYLKPRVTGEFRSFLATATGYGTVGVKDGRPFIEIVAGTIPFRRIVYVPA